jgi:hypothetical protein
MFGKCLTISNLSVSQMFQKRLPNRSSTALYHARLLPQTSDRDHSRLTVNDRRMVNNFIAYLRMLASHATPLSYIAAIFAYNILFGKFL